MLEEIIEAASYANRNLQRKPFSFCCSVIPPPRLTIFTFPSSSHFWVAKDVLLNFCIFIKVIILLFKLVKWVFLDLSRPAKKYTLYVLVCYCFFLKIRNDLLSPLMIIHTLKMKTLFRVKVTKRKWYAMCITTAGVYYFINLIFLG